MTPAALTQILLHVRPRRGAAPGVDDPGAEAVRAAFDVSRETMAPAWSVTWRCSSKWNPRINLVSRASLADAWARHFADSAQLWRCGRRRARVWLDLGSGAGFPGLVIAAMAAEAAPARGAIWSRATSARRRSSRGRRERRASGDGPCRARRGLPPHGGRRGLGPGARSARRPARLCGKTPPAGGYWLVSQGRDGA